MYKDAKTLGEIRIKQEKKEKARKESSRFLRGKFVAPN